MTDEEFDALALRVLSGNARPEEALELQGLLAAEDARASQFKELKEAYQITAALLPVTEALQSGEKMLPAYRMQELRGEVRKCFPKNPALAQERVSVIWEFLFAPPVWGMAAVLLCGLLLFEQARIGSGPVEFGGYAGTSMRGEQEQLPEDLKVRVTVRSFEREDQFANWQKGNRVDTAKARIWFDDEKDLVHVLRPGGLFSPSVMVTYPLPENPRWRVELLRKILGSLQSGAPVAF